MPEIDLLTTSVLFQGCDDEQRASLVAISEAREYANGQIILAHGDEAREVMIIAAGFIRLEMPLSILGEARAIPFEEKMRGDVVGWSALVPPYRFTLSARAHGAAAVLSLGRTELHELFDRDAVLARRVMSNLASIIGQRLHHTQEMWVTEVQRSLDGRYR